METSQTIYCGECKEEIKILATMWCRDCEKALCSGCKNVHTAIKTSEYHNLITVEKYIISNISIDQTSHIHDEPLEFFCESHDSVLCSLCLPLIHSSCSDIIPLQEAAKNAKITFDDVNKTINGFLRDFPGLIDEHIRDSKEIDAHVQRIQKEIAAVRKKLITHLNAVEQTLMNELKKFVKDKKSENERAVSSLRNAKKRIIGLQKQTQNLLKNGSKEQVFLETRRTNILVHETMNNVIPLKKYNIKFEVKPEINSILTSVKSFGTIKTEMEENEESIIPIKLNKTETIAPSSDISDVILTLKHAFKIKVAGLITGCVSLFDGKLILAINWGEEHLLYLHENGIIIRDISLSRMPYDVAVVDVNRVAVSYERARFIEVIELRNGIVQTKVNFKGCCRGLSFYCDKLYVVVRGQGIAIVDLSGEVVENLDISVRGVCYITTAEDRIYYTDEFNNTVTCCNMAGKQLWEFESDEMKCPQGITTDLDQNVFVAGHDSFNVTVISGDGQTNRVLLTSNDGLQYPGPIFFNEHNKTILVCSDLDEKAFIFNSL